MTGGDGFDLTPLGGRSAPIHGRSTLPGERKDGGSLPLENAAASPRATISGNQNLYAGGWNEEEEKNNGASKKDGMKVGHKQ